LLNSCNYSEEKTKQKTKHSHKRDSVDSLSVRVIQSRLATHKESELGTSLSLPDGLYFRKQNAYKLTNKKERQQLILIANYSSYNSIFHREKQRSCEIEEFFGREIET